TVVQARSTRLSYSTHCDESPGRGGALSRAVVECRPGGADGQVPRRALYRRPTRLALAQTESRHDAGSSDPGGGMGTRAPLRLAVKLASGRPGSSERTVSDARENF